MLLYSVCRQIAVGRNHVILLATKTSAAEGKSPELAVIKQLLPAAREQPELQGAFAQMVTRVQTFSHAHLPTYCGGGELVGDDFSYAMEYVSGEDLAYVLSHERQMERRIALAVTCAITAQIAAALDAWQQTTAEAHGDVCPSSIVLGYSGRAVLLDPGIDFGVSRTVAEPAAEPSAAQQPLSPSKLLYCSPEQVSGQPLSGRSDLFSLGIVLHEMLTSRKLFSGPTASAIMHNIRERRIPRPSVYNPEVPKVLDELILELLVREVDERTITAAAVSQQLKRIAKTYGASSSRSIARWAKRALEVRHQERIAAEDAVRLAMRAQTGDDGPLSPGMQWPPFLPEQPPTRSPSLEALSGTFSQPSITAPVSMADSAFSHASLSGQRRRSSRASGVWQPEQSNPVPATLDDGIHSAAPHEATGTGGITKSITIERRRRPIILWITAAVAIVLSLGVFALVSQARKNTAEATDGRTTAERISTPPSPLTTDEQGPTKNSPPTHARPNQEVAFHVYVVPNGATVRIDDRVMVEALGDDGVLVPVPAKASVRLTVSKDGFASHVAQVEAPHTGVMPIYIALTPASADVADATAAPDNHTETPEHFVGESARIATETSAPNTQKEANTSSSTAQERRMSARRNRRNERRREREQAPKTTSEGFLQLAFHPDSAAISVAGINYSGGSPTQLALNPGKHQITVSADGYITRQKMITIRAGEYTKLTLDLQQQTSTIAVTSKPAGARVMIDNAYRGNAPLKIDDIPSGKRVEVELSLEGYRPIQRQITTNSERVANVSVELERVSPPPSQPSPTPKAPVTVTASAVKKLSGALPVIRLRGAETQTGDSSHSSKPINTRICITSNGRVSSVKVLDDMPAKMLTALERALKTWRYEPYRQDGTPVPACFQAKYRLKIEFT